MKPGPLSALLAALLGPPAPLGAQGPPLRREALRAAQLEVTLGALEEGPAGRLRVESPKMRAVVRPEARPAAPAGTGPAASPAAPLEAELAFTYLGPTRQQAPLASGELRRQVGLKLRAQDGCNLVYAMWRLAPREGLVVSVKRNPGRRRHEECGAGGYRTVRPRLSRPLPPLRPGERHTLRARLEGEALEVQVDGAVVWRGLLGAEVLQLVGPVGLRTDNGRFELELRTP